MTKKILFILSGVLNIGGIEKYNQNLIRISVEAGYSVNVISRNDQLNKFGDIPIYSYGHITNDLCRKAAFSLMVLMRACIFSPDIIVCGHVNFSPLCYFFSFLLRKKYIVLTHGIDVWNCTSKLKIKGLKEAHSIISISNFTKNKLIEQIPQVKNKIQLLPNTVDSSVFYPGPRPDYLMERHKLKKHNTIILTVGRLSKTEENKGYYKVLDVLPDILKELPESKYILVGSGDDLENIRSYIIEKNLEDAVILTGHVSDNELPDYYNLCDVFVMPSKKEGFGIVFLEAMACGKPVICGNKDGSVDAVLNGEVGLMVDPDNREEIKQAIINVINKNYDKRLFNGDYLRKRIIGEYGYDRFREKVKNIFESWQN